MTVGSVPPGERQATRDVAPPRRPAWSLAMRYSFLGLNDGGLSDMGRTLHDVAVGLNWYLNPHTRIM